MHHPAPPQRSCPRGFTLVELLAVIMIIALLMGLLTPAVMRALASTRNAAIKAEIDMLHMAIMNYKNEYGSFPPCVSSTNTADSAARHIQRLFPRTVNVANEVTAAVTPANAIFGWLSGYSPDPTKPVTGGSRAKLFDFDSSRVTTSGMYYPSGKQSSPYVYIRSGTSATAGYGVITGTTTNAAYVIGANTYSPQIQVTVSGTAFFNPETFQILCAGRDEIFGTGDDLSNFWPSTRQDYLDNLRN